MKEKIRSLIMRSLLSPINVRYCSQTVYESLLGCCRMWEATKESLWRERANRLALLLMQIQRPDGGFDIGYEFNFGRLHKKGDSTSPELVALVALSEFARLFSDESVATSAHKAAKWIRRFARRVAPGQYAIPYSPHTIHEVMVYNGTSFACSALGCYLGQFGGDDELREIYVGMASYLDSVMDRDEGRAGRFWFYNDQSRTDLDPLRRSKIDYYHQMQQVEMHALAEQRMPTDHQAVIFRDASDHVVALHREYGGVVPYTNSNQFFKGHVHLWGLSSVTSGLIEAAAVHADRADAYLSVARETMDWILQHAWTGDCFAPVVTAEGEPVTPLNYMVRSDAWVFNALAAAIRQFPDFQQLDIAETCYRRMGSVDFSGPESHASNLRLRLASSALRVVRELAN